MTKSAVKKASAKKTGAGAAKRAAASDAATSPDTANSGPAVVEADAATAAVPRRARPVKSADASGREATAADAATPSEGADTATAPAADAAAGVGVGEAETADGAGVARPPRPGKRPARRAGATGKKSARPRKRKSTNPLAAFSEDDADDPRRARAKRRKRLGGARGKARDAQVKPSPPLTETDPLGRYLAGEMVPCPVGCGGFSEVVHIGTLPSGAGEVWFECLSCAQRKSFAVEAPSTEEIERVLKASDSGGEVYCPRCSRNAILRRRGKHLVCPDCGVMVNL